MEKDGLLPQAASPPPYEAPAYFRRRSRSRVLVRGLLSLRTVFSFILTACVIWLCFVVSRETREDGGPFNVSGDKYFEDAVAQCAARNALPPKPDPASRKANSRWGTGYGQEGRVVLKNATLFDGETFIDHAVDITFHKGLIEAVVKSGEGESAADAVKYDLHGRYVTPGLVDMHSHHLVVAWPRTDMPDDAAETTKKHEGLVPMVRIIDGLKPHDKAAAIIASGGVTTSLVIPGSSNIVNGEGTVVKNMLYSGPDGEPVVEDLLLERGIPQAERRRYMKMAFGENPKNVWGYSRLGVAWELRALLQKAKDLIAKQDDYCAGVEAAGSLSADAKTKFVAEKGKFPFELDLESMASLLRGQVLLQNHNYEPQDMEAMLRISKEFGFRVAGFHHALEAWQVPHMLKDHDPNITIATFAEFSLYKHEAYSPSLYAGYILDKNGVKVAYKSDHVDSFTSAKYLLSQAAVGHAFHLPTDKALQAVTSIPAAAIDQDHRVGYCRVGYDADIAVWDSHPLSRGATALQVFIDGIPQFNETQVAKSTGTSWTEPRPAGADDIDVVPQVRHEPEDARRGETCAAMAEAKGNFVISGVKKAFLHNYPEFANKGADKDGQRLQLVINEGKITCFNTASECALQTEAVKEKDRRAVLDLSNGYATPGLTALTNSLGTRELISIDGAGDGTVSDEKITEPGSVAYAKHGLWLDGKSFARARFGGVTRAITAPFADQGFITGVSVEFVTSGKKSLLHGAIVQEDVALHVSLGDKAAPSQGAVSTAVKKIRAMLTDGAGKNNETVFGQVARGELPLLVHAQNKVWKMGI